MASPLPPNCAGEEFRPLIRHCILCYPEYWFEVDEYRRGEEVFLLAHLRFAKFTPAIFKRWLAEWQAFRACVTAPVFAIGEVDDEKFERFVTRLGFEPAMNVVCINGVERRMFRHLVGNVRRKHSHPNPAD